MQHLKELRSQLRALRREMKERGVRRISCFNGGLTMEEYRYNSECFALETKIKLARENLP